MPPIVTLTTDFEEREPFVATIKGMLLTRCPGVQIVDLSHQIPRADVMEGALFMARAVPYFPAGTIHLVGVAPGPGPIVVSIHGQRVVCPDNGLITILAERFEVEEKWSVAVPEAVSAKGGQTFYSRDIFAPIAAQLAAGTSLAEIGEPREQVTLLDLPRPEKRGKNKVSGAIMHVDRFGNLLSNIHRSYLEGSRVTSVEVGHFPIGALSETYAQVPQGKPLALYGSAGYLEIAYNGDRADRRLEMGKGIIVTVTIEPNG